jgi:hypothetical protein
MTAHASFWITLALLVEGMIVFYVGWRLGLRDGVSERTGSSRE